MSWIEGRKITSNKELPEEQWERQYAIEGFIEEDVAKLELFKFLKSNVSVASSLLLGIDLYPIQSILVKTMMERDYVIDIISRGGSKSFLSGVFAALYAMMVPNSKIGIISSSFRQAKHIFRYIEKFASDKKGYLFNDCIKKTTKSNDEWCMEIGSSTIVAVPLGDGSKLRGFRFTVLLIDELLLMPKKILNEVILPFISVIPNPTERDKIKEAEDFLIKEGLMKESDRYVWPNNKFIGLSSASYAFEYLYELYKVYEQLIISGVDDEAALEKIGESKKNKSSRAIVHLSYEALPPGQYEQSAIENFKATMSENQFGRELLSRFTDDSGGFFKIAKMRSCTVPDGEDPTVEIKGDPSCDYIVSLDPSWAENDTSDDFAIQILKINYEKKITTLVHSYAIAGAKLKRHIEYFLYVLKNFNVVMIWSDYAGGLQFINSCNESEIFKDAKISRKSDKGQGRI